MAASLTYRNSTATSNSKPNASWQDVSLERRRPEKLPFGRGDSGDRLSLSKSEREGSLLSSSFRKRPRSEGWSGEKRRESEGDTKRSSSTEGNHSQKHHSTPIMQSSSSTQQKIHKSGGETRLPFASSKGQGGGSLGSSGGSRDQSKAARRSSLESAKSTATTSSSGSGGFRRLKKFSPGKKKKKATSANCKAHDEIPVTETFQQTQLRLWKAAQERHQKLKEEEEKKRLEKLRKKKLRQQLKQERMGKLATLGKAPVVAKGKDSSVGKENTGVKEEAKTIKSLAEARDILKLKKLKNANRDLIDGSKPIEIAAYLDSPKDRESFRSEKQCKKLERHSVSWSRNNEHGQTTQSSQRSIVGASNKDDESKSTSLQSKDKDDMKAKKKLKRLKKLRRLSGHSTSTQASSDEALRLTSQSATQFTAAAEPEEAVSKMDSSTMMTSSDTTAGEAFKKKTKKKRLVKLGSISDDADLPSSKKTKVNADSMHQESYATNKNPRKDSAETDDRGTAPSTPLRKLAISSSLGAAPLTPLSFGLADTVKTRVRSPAKVKDELELLQVASFEKKKRKKNKVAKNSVHVSGLYGEHRTLKKKKKKKQPLFMDAHVQDCSVLDALTKNKLDCSINDQKEEIGCDADDEAPCPWAFDGEGRKERLPETSIETMSEASSSTTIVTGKIKKKKNRLKKFESDKSMRSFDYEIQAALETANRRREQPLPLKKRMTMAAAAAESASWERNAAASTAASKVSISSAGTGSGATPEFGTEASSISEFTHPLESMALPPRPTSATIFHLSSSVPREILSKSPDLPARAHSFRFTVNTHSTIVGTNISSSEDSDSDSSDTDEEELFSWANMMFGTSAKPVALHEQETSSPVEVNPILTPELCEMERRRQKQEEARTLSIMEVNAILQEEENKTLPVAEHWVRRSVRQPSQSLLNAPLTRALLDKLRGNDGDMVVLKMKKYLSDPDTPSMIIDAALEALEECTNCEALYIQNFNIGMRDKQVLHLLRILQMPTCNIWCLNIGETYNVTEETWEAFAEGLKNTKITHMYASEHTITAELKDEIRETIRFNRRKHDMHIDPNNLDVIVRCTHCWWNPINAKVLRPYLRKRGFESLLHDSEAQGLRGSISEAPAL